MFFSVKLEGRDGTERRTQIPSSLIVPSSLSPSFNALTSISLCLSRVSLQMEFCFGLVAIFLILDVFSIRCIDGTAKKSDKVELSLGIVSNPFLQPSIKFPNTQNQNPFLASTNDNKNENPFLPFASQISNTTFSNNNYNPFPNSINNPFLNPVRTDTRVETKYSSPPVTQRPFTILPHYYNISASMPIFSIPVKNDFINSTYSHTHTPPKIRPPDSRFPPLEDLIPIKTRPVTTISERKCDEYVEEIAGTISITSLTGSSSGVIKVTNVCKNTNFLVVGGTEAQIGEFPHMVALGRRPNSEFILMCGGSLISHSWVLSAAHCTYGPDGGPTHARMGFHRLISQNGITVAIKNATRHPDYKPPAMYADIALIKLMNDITFSTSIRPACLYQKYDTVPRKAWVSGWGVTEYAGEVSDQLQKVELDLVDNLFCTIRHNSSTEVPYGVTPSMICAGDPRGNWTKDSCQGDSGGPLQIIYPKGECLFQVIGVTSFGQGCALIDIPGVYTRVSHYLPWIEDNVWPQGQ